MRLYDDDSDRTLSSVALYLTTSEIAQLYGLLGSMLTDIRVKDCRVGDEGYRHTLNVYLYSEHETTGFDRRQRTILTEDR